MQRSPYSGCRMPQLESELREWSGFVPWFSLEGADIRQFRKFGHDFHSRQASPTATGRASLYNTTIATPHIFRAARAAGDM